MATKSTSVKLTLKITSFVLRLLLTIVFYILIVILIINVSKAAYDFTYQLYGPVRAEAPPGTTIYFQIKKGESTMDIASKLELNLAIKNKMAFYVKTKLQNLNIMPGTYIINSSMTYDEILDIITDYSASIIKDDSAVDTEDKDNTGAETGEESQEVDETETGDGTTAGEATDGESNAEGETAEAGAGSTETSDNE